MQKFFGSRSASAVYKRGNAILKFVHWYRSQYFSFCPFPLTHQTILEYFTHLEKSKAPASTLSGFLESFNFCFHVFGVEVVAKNTGPTLKLPKQCRRRVELREPARSERRQAPALLVSEVTALEELMVDEKEAAQDRVAAGCFLFCLRSRSRWSDVQKVYGFSQDVIERGALVRIHRISDSQPQDG